MRFRGHRLSGFSGLVLVLALAGLLVMHGFDAGAASGGGGGHAVSATVHHDMAPAAGVSHLNGAMPDQAPSDRAMSTEDAGQIRAAVAGHTGLDHAGLDHAGLGHVVAMCMVVVAAATSTGVVRRILGGVRARVAAAARAAGRPARAVEVGRPPGPGRLELCILRC